MDNFKVYLPSNSSQHVFPNNTSSNYTTQLLNPIHLEGKWEVAAESLYYYSNIGNMNEKAQLSIEWEEKKDVSVNDMYPFKYKLKNGRWNYEWSQIKISSINAPMEEILNAMNGINDIILDRSDSLVTFENRGNVIYYNFKSDGLSIRLSNSLAKFLGFDYLIFLTMNYRNKRGIHGINRDEKLDPKDFYFQIFDRNLCKVDHRIILKKKGEDVPLKEEFVKRWQTLVTTPYGVTLKDKNDKLVMLLPKDKKVAVYPNIPLMYYIHHNSAIFSDGGEIWPSYAYGLRKNYFSDTSIDYEWEVTLYQDELARITQPHYHIFEIDLYPRHYSTIDKLLDHLNHVVDKRMNEVMKENRKKSQVTFNMRDLYVHMTLNDIRSVRFSENFAYLLGYELSIYFEGEYLGDRLPIMLDKIEQQMFIHLDCIEATNYGISKEQHLQQFVHSAGQDYGIIEKRFEPMTYFPIMRNYMDQITVTIMNVFSKPISIKDSKTILILHFRKNN